MISGHAEIDTLQGAVRQIRAHIIEKINSVVASYAQRHLGPQICSLAAIFARGCGAPMVDEGLRPGVAAIAGFFHPHCGSRSAVFETCVPGEEDIPLRVDPCARAKQLQRGVLESKHHVLRPGSPAICGDRGKSVVEVIKANGSVLRTLPSKQPSCLLELP